MKNSFLLVAAAFLIVSCTNVNKPKTEAEKVPSELEIFQAQVKNVVPEVADITQVAVLLEASGADFMPQLVNDPHNVEKYKLTKYLAAANLGIYTADAVYQASYRQAEGAQLSYAAAKTLAFHIGIGEAFDGIFLDRIVEGVTANDSVLNKLDAALANSKTILSDKEEAGLFTAMLIGANIEKLYVLNNNIFNYPVDLPDESKLLILRQTVLVLAKQMEILEGLTVLFEEYKPDTDGATHVFNLIKEVRDIYAPLKLQDNIQTVEPKKLFENKELLTAFEKIKEIRNLITIAE